MIGRPRREHPGEARLRLARHGACVTPLHVACVTLCLLWPGVIYHNSDLDRFVEKTEEEESRRKTVEAPSETGGLLSEFEGKVERELAEFLETTSQGRCSMTLGGVKSGQGPEHARLTCNNSPPKVPGLVPIHVQCTL